MFLEIEMHTYINPFHNKHYTGSKPLITTSAKPEERSGHLIFKVADQHYDIVKDGVLFTQMAGRSGAHKFVDRLA